MRLIQFEHTNVRRTVDRSRRIFDGSWEFDDRYLQRKVTVRLFGVRLFDIWKDVRVVPVHEWSRAAFGEAFTFEDQYPAERLNRKP